MRKDWASFFLVGAHVLPFYVLLGNGQNAHLAFFIYIALVTASAGYDASADLRRRGALLTQLVATSPESAAT